MPDFTSSSTWWVIGGLALVAWLFVSAFVVKILARKKRVHCNRCKWEGKEDELDIYTSCEDEKEPEEWFAFCPECGSANLTNITTETKLKLHLKN